MCPFWTSDPVHTSFRETKDTVPGVGSLRGKEGSDEGAGETT